MKKLNNVIFPIWLIVIIPPVILITLPANFIVDSLVILLAFYLLKISDKLIKYKKCILKVWGFGFLTDIIGSFLLFSTVFLDSFDFLAKNLMEPIMWNPFSNPIALVYEVCVITLSGYLIYLFNYKFSFQKPDLDEEQKKKVSLLLAIITAPYLFLLPTSLFY